MKEELTLDDVVEISEGVVSRRIEGELIVIPVTAGIGSLEDEIYTLNETGEAIWELLDGKSSLKEISEMLITRYDAVTGEIEQDVLGLANELYSRKMLRRGLQVLGA